MNSIATSKLPGRALGNLAIACSLFLHVVLIALFSSWQWDWKTPERIPPKIIQVKLLPVPPSPLATETPHSPQPTPRVPARPMTTQPNSKPHLMPRTPNLLTPTFQREKMAYRMIRSHSKSIKRPLAQPTSFTNTKLIPAVSPANSSRYTPRIDIHRRSSVSEIRISKISNAPARTAIPTEPVKTMSPRIHRRPSPAQSNTTAQINFTSQAVTEPLTSQKTVRDTFAALPRELPQSLLPDRETPDANLGALRGLFTGKVRQRIANAKYYPRIARRRGMEGRPIIAFTLDRQGRLTKVGLAKTSGYQLLDRAALEAVHQAAPYPEIPAPLKMNSFQFKLPISFILK
jgi:TonB family protein